MFDKEAQIKYYENLLAKHGDSYKTLDWNSSESQKLRFQILSGIFLFGHKEDSVSVLDVGAGLGDLYGFFKEQGMLESQKINYSGVDISPKLTETAASKYPGVKFAVKDILEGKDPLKYDCVFCSGIFNIRTAEKEKHLAYVKAMLKKMYEMSNYGVSVNFLSEDVMPFTSEEDLKSGRYFFFNPGAVLDYCRAVSQWYILRHDYHFGDFTLYLLK